MTIDEIAEELKLMGEEYIVCYYNSDPSKIDKVITHGRTEGLSILIANVLKDFGEEEIKTFCAIYAEVLKDKHEPDSSELRRGLLPFGVAYEILQDELKPLNDENEKLKEKNNQLEITVENLKTALNSLGHKMEEV